MAVKVRSRQYFFRYYTVTLSKVVFLRRSSSVKGRLPSKVVFRQRSSFVKGHLPSPSKVIFCQRSSSVKSHLPVHCYYSCLVSESSNYKLGCLDKVLVLKFVLKPRYQVQNGSWPNHKKDRLCLIKSWSRGGQAY